MAELNPKLLDLPVYLEGCDCTNEWSGDITPTGVTMQLDIEREPRTTLEIKVDPRVEELRKRGILPP
jgi:hypothetical protein